MPMIKAQSSAMDLMQIPVNRGIRQAELPSNRRNRSFKLKITALIKLTNNAETLRSIETIRLPTSLGYRSPNDLLSHTLG